MKFLDSLKKLCCSKKVIIDKKAEATSESSNPCSCCDHDHAESQKKTQ